MTSSSYPSEPFLLGLSQTILGGAWRPKTFRKIPKPPGNWLDGLTARGLAELREELAIKWLAARPDLRTAKRDDHKPDCIRKFRITGFFGLHGGRKFIAHFRIFGRKRGIQRYRHNGASGNGETSRK